MKKIVIISLLTLLCSLSCYAATNNYMNNGVNNGINNQQFNNSQNVRNRNIFRRDNTGNYNINNHSVNSLKTNRYSNYYDENYINGQDFDVIQLEKPQDAFANNYQNLTSNNKYELSQVEKLFNGNEVEVTSNPLRQVGYDFFTAPITQNMNSTGKFDDSYKLTIGEKVSAYLYGDSVDVVAISGSNLLSPVVQTEVDSKGNIFISGIGVVPAENRSIKDVESAINRMASSKYNNLKVRLNVASGRDFSVFVYGQVNKPGKVVINNNSSIIDALGAAGGVVLYYNMYEHSTY